MQNDSFNGLPPQKHSILPVVILAILSLISVAFAIWAFISMTDYKNNSDKKSDTAVSIALTEQKTKLDLEYEEKAKSPFENYKASSEFGSLSISYPKSWSLYVDSKASSAASSIEGYGHPDYVPGLTSDTSFALRFQVTTRDYNVELKTFDGGIKTGVVKVSPFKLGKVKEDLGAKVEGQINNKKSGILYMFPLRDKTIKIWTEGNSYLKDLDAIITNLTFVP
jgi:hypothetical protein